MITAIVVLIVMAGYLLVSKMAADLGKQRREKAEYEAWREWEENGRWNR